MSAESLPEQRTEHPTEKRMGEIRKEGAVHHSHDLVQVLGLMTGFITISWLVTGIQRDVLFVFKRAFQMVGEQREPLTTEALRVGFIHLVLKIAPNIFLLTIIIAFAAVLATMLQTNWNVKKPWIKFKWNILDPIGGIKKLFSVQQFVNTGKAIAKLALILPIGYFALQSLAPRMVRLINTSIPDIMNVTAIAIDSVFWKIMYVLIALAIFDYVWGRYRWFRQNNMTKEEVKDERKATEGDETMRRKMINKGMQRVYSRIMQSVPKADVIVTNPTHYAVALKYERGKTAAPVVVAKGADFIAFRIREIAKESGVPILERKALARALFASTEVGQEIPRELFKAVAEVLAYVYKLKNPFRKAVAR